MLVISRETVCTQINIAKGTNPLSNYHLWNLVVSINFCSHLFVTTKNITALYF